MSIILIVPQEYVATFDICIISSSFLLTCGSDFLYHFSLPVFSDFTRLICTTFLKPFAEVGFKLLLLSFFS